MNVDELKKIVQEGEHETIEFKASTGQLISGAKDFCGMLNRNGGYLFFGVKDDGSIVGQEISDKTRKSIGNMLSQFSPEVNVGIEYIEVSDTNKYVIAMFSHNNNLKP